jgi:hypothetical protein
MNQMRELFEASFNVVNLPATLLLIVVLLHWLIVMVGAMDMISLESELDFDLETETDGADIGDWLLDYFNARYVPLSILLSIFSLSFWVISMYANWYIHQNQSGLLGLAIFAGNLVISSHIAKFTTAPLLPIFKSMKEQMSSKLNLVGKQAVVTSSKADAKFGQAQVRLDGPEITLNVRTEGEELLRGTEVVILQHEQATDIYIITQLEI